jgi:FkbM family methyltransferase
MSRNPLKRLTRPIWWPFIRRLEAIEQSLARLELAQGTSPSVASMPEALREELASLREDVWHSKAVNLGDRLLVGARPFGLVFLIEPDDRLLGPRFVLDGEYETDTTAYIMRTVESEDVCIDVGANFGYFTCLMARRAWQGRTIAFEPDPRVFELLRENVFVNWCQGAVETVNAAVGDRIGTTTLHRRIGRSANTSLIAPSPDELDPTGEARTEELSVGTVTLDSYADRLERVDLVKIDVEGAETLVVKGMHELVRRHRPTILLEWSPGQAAEGGYDLKELAEQLRSLDLSPSVLLPGGDTREIRFGELAKLDYQNVLFTPRS